MDIIQVELYLLSCLLFSVELAFYLERVDEFSSLTRKVYSAVPFSDEAASF